MGHPLRGLSDGFVGLGLYALLAQEAIRDLLAYSGLVPGDARLWNDTALFLCISGARTTEREEQELDRAIKQKKHPKDLKADILNDLNALSEELLEQVKTMRAGVQLTAAGA